MIGFDTGFFIKVLEGHKTAIAIWQKLIHGEQKALCSSLTLFELERLTLKGGISKDANAVLQEAVPEICHIIWLKEISILSAAARVSHGINMPAIDALILAGLIKEGAQEIYTTDNHFEAYQKKGVKIVNLQKIN